MKPRTIQSRSFLRTRWVTKVRKLVPPINNAV